MVHTRLKLIPLDIFHHKYYARMVREGSGNDGIQKQGLSTRSGNLYMNLW